MLSEFPLIGVIGVGHFGKALINGLVSSQEYKVKCSNLTPLKFNEPSLNEVIVITDNKKLSEEVDTLIIAVRPQDVGVVLEDIQDYKGLVITFAAGLPISYYEERLHNAIIVRGMSNLGVAHQKGMSAWVGSDAISEHQLNWATSLFSNLGNQIQYSLDEEYNLDIVTALSGSGIGYLANVFDIMQKWGGLQGLSETDSEKIVVGALKSLIEIYNQSELSLEEIVFQVASEGGTTQSGLKIMENKGLSMAMSQGLDETLLKCVDLSQCLNRKPEEFRSGG